MAAPTSKMMGLVLVMLLLLSGISATSFKVVNNCANTVQVQVAENSGGPTIGTAGFSLAPGQAQGLNPPNGWAGNIGSGTPGLLAEFSINLQTGLDDYDVSAVNGFFMGVGMSITGDGQTLTCSAAASICPAADVRGSACVNPNRDDPSTTYAQSVMASCPDAFSWSGDNTKVHATPTAGTFTITFCP